MKIMRNVAKDVASQNQHGIGPGSNAHNTAVSAPSKLPIEKTSWTLGNL